MFQGVRKPDLTNIPPIFKVSLALDSLEHLVYTTQVCFPPARNVGFGGWFVVCLRGYIHNVFCVGIAKSV